MITMAKKIVLFVGVATLLATPVLGEYYRYVDANGMTRYTDDLSRIPPNQRPKVKTYESVKSESVPPSSNASFANDMPRKKSSGKGMTWSEKAVNQAHELNLTRLELDKTYQVLQVERKALLKKPSGRIDAKKNKAYREQVQQLNAKIADYETRYAAYKEQLDKFNKTYKK